MNEPKLNHNIKYILDICLISAPKSCPYVNDSIEITYSNSEKQYFTHKNDNPNDLNYDFESHKELKDYFDKIQKQL
jgi:hypothetical protein